MNRFAIPLIALLASGSDQAFAQEPVRELQDLVGARGSSGETQLHSRGCTWVGGEKSGGSSFTYWQKGSSRNCISVRTEDGRYQSISHVPEADCQRVATPQATVAGKANDDQGTKDRFDTVCGAIVDGKPYRYRCVAVDVYRDGRKARTVLHYPDQKIALVWKSGNQAAVHFEGMKPQPATVTTSEGETNFRIEDKTYFYISNKEAAKLEVQHFQD